LNSSLEKGYFDMIDVFICSYGILDSPERSLRRCIKSIQCSDIPVNRIVVLSKNISEELRQFAEKEGIILKKQEEDKPLGYHRAECIRWSKTKWCMFVDDDVYLPYNWYDKIKRHVVNKYVAIQGCKVYDTNDKFSYYNEANNHILSVKEHRLFQEHGIYMCSFENTLLNTQLIKKIGGDSELAKYDSREDWALFFFLKQRGYHWLCLPSIRVLHNYQSKKTRQHKIRWYAQRYQISRVNLVMRIFTSLEDIMHLTILLIKRSCISLYMVFYCIYFYVVQRWHLFRTLTK
jgi:hypothetical protein